MKINNIKLLIFSVFCVSCSNSKQSELPLFVLEELEVIGKEKLALHKIINLETTSENLIGSDIRVRYDASVFYLMDEGNKDGIHQFDRNGDYLGIIAPEGDGLGYLEDLDDFFINPDGSVEVLSGIGDQATVYHISEAGEISTVFETDYLASSLPNCHPENICFMEAIISPLPNIDS